MGIRLEYVIILALVFTVVLTTIVDLTNTVDNTQISSKELAFSDTTFIEVDKEKMQARSFATYGVRDAGILHLKNLKYHTKNVELLLSDKATYKSNTLYLDGNVSLLEKEGFLYMAQHAKYNQKTEMLNITSAFTAKMDQNIIKGQSLQYNALKKEINATGIDAVVYTTKK